MNSYVHSVNGVISL